MLSWLSNQDGRNHDHAYELNTDSPDAVSRVDWGDNPSSTDDGDDGDSGGESGGESEE